MLVSATLLALSAIGSGSTSAANSRILYVGSLTNGAGVVIDANGDGIPDKNGVLVPTAVNMPGSADSTTYTVVPVQVLNGDNQTIAHVVLSFPLRDQSTGTQTQLPSGLSIVGVGGPDNAACGFTVPTQSLTCTFDNLAAGALRSVYFLVSVTSSYQLPGASPVFTTSVTTNNENGSNLQYFSADSGAFAVQPFSPTSLNTFTPPGQAKQTYETGFLGAGNSLKTRVDFTNGPNGNLVGMHEDSGGTNYACPTDLGLTCQPLEATVSIQDGLTGNSAFFTTSPYLTVTLTATVYKTYSLSKAFVAHYTNAGVRDWVLYWSTKSTQCSKSTTLPCFLSASTTKPDANGFETLTLQVIVDHNGGYRY